MGAQPVFIGAVGRKTTSYEANYHSSKGKLAALNFTLHKFQHLLLQGEFFIRTEYNGLKLDLYERSMGDCYAIVIIFFIFPILGLSSELEGTLSMPTTSQGKMK